MLRIMAIPPPTNTPPPSPPSLPEGAAPLQSRPLPPSASRDTISSAQETKEIGYFESGVKKILSLIGSCFQKTWNCYNNLSKDHENPPIEEETPPENRGKIARACRWVFTSIFCVFRVLRNCFVNLTKAPFPQKEERSDS